jgi:hypoxanthine phosphoribosyltransferase
VTDKIAERVSRVLFSAEQIEQRVHEVGKQICLDYTNGSAKDPKQRPPLLVCVLHGALVFMADLARQIPTEVEYDFISVSSYGNGTSPGAVRLVKDLERPIEGRDILIVEDIVDTGYTIDYLRRGFAARRPASIRICSLIDKVARRETDVQVDYVGFPLQENAFIVGYGMDYQELYRNLPFIGVLKPEFIK